MHTEGHTPGQLRETNDPNTSKWWRESESTREEAIQTAHSDALAGT